MLQPTVGPELDIASHTFYGEVLVGLSTSEDDGVTVAATSQCTEHTSTPRARRASLARHPSPPSYRLHSVRRVSSTMHCVLQ